MESIETQIRQRYESTLDRISMAAQSAGRSSDAIGLVVVTKSQPLDVVQAAIQAGARILGENYPNESVSKIQAIPPQSGVEWHMIGHVQSRKARLVIEHFDLLQSLDSVKLAQRLDRFAAEAGRVLPVLLEFNVGGEASKYGWPAANEEQCKAIYPDVELILDLPNLEVRGLMTMPPLETDPEEARRISRSGCRLADQRGASEHLQVVGECLGRRYGPARSQDEQGHVDQAPVREVRQRRARPDPAGGPLVLAGQGHLVVEEVAREEGDRFLRSAPVSPQVDDQGVGVG